MERKFANKETRTYEINKFLAICSSVCLLIQVAAVFLARGKAITTSLLPEYAFLVFALISIIVQMSMTYSRRINAQKARRLLIIIFCISFAWCDIFSSNLLAPFIVYVPIICTMLYDEKKYAIGETIGVTIIEIATKIFDLLGATPGTEAFNNFLFAVGLCLAFFVGIILCVRVEKRFNEDIFGLIEDQRSNEEHIFKTILGIADEVRKETTQIGHKLGNLGKSSKAIANSIDEIALGNQTTCESIEKQNVMTQAIQAHIVKNADQIKEVSEVANKVNASINEGQQAVEEVMLMAKNSKAHNMSAVEAMQGLDIDAKEMEKAANVIMQISTQTNLLALNASIEAARAGDAGKGFAVVAEEIRKLADQTKESTKEITDLIANLNEGTQLATQEVQRVVSETDLQAERVSDVEKHFLDINEQIKVLAGSIDQIKVTAEELMRSNETIVESISQLSAVSEEVAASSEQVKNISTKNLAEVSEAVLSVETVIKTAEALEKYQH